MATEGELWTRDALRELRSSRYRPRAWGRFLAASRARARATAAARPDLSRQARRWEAVMLASALAAAPLLRRVGLPAPSARAHAAWALAEAAMLDWHLGMVEEPDRITRACARAGGSGESSRPKPRRLASADALTVARAWLAPIALVAPRQPVLAGGVLAIATLSDAADGALARRAGPTRLGGALDPAADIACLGALAWGAWRERQVAPWALAALAGRYAASVGRNTWHYFAHAESAPPAGAATRVTAPATAAGFGLVLSGSRRLGSALVATGSLTAMALTFSRTRH